jgi:hypothetical protein
VDHAVTSPGSPDRSSPPRRPGGGDITALVTAVLTGIGALYVGTHSVVITVIAAVMSIALAAMVLFSRR